MLCLLAILPILSHSCTTRPPQPPPTYWTTFCDIGTIFSNSVRICDSSTQIGQQIPQRRLQNQQTLPKIFVGVEVDLHTTTAAAPESCKCGGKISNTQTTTPLTATAAYVTWSCHKPEMHQGIYDDNGNGFFFTPDTSVINDVQAVLGSGGSLFGLSTPNQFVFANGVPSQPTTQCPDGDGWTLKFWFCIGLFRFFGGDSRRRRRAQDFQFGTFSLDLVAGSSDTVNHPLAPISPSNTIVGAGGGDVHFTTLDSVQYTFNAAGDYIYLKTIEKKFDLHVRQVMVPDVNGSVLAALGLRDNDIDNVVELWWSGSNSKNVNVNGRYSGDKKNTKIDLDDRHHSSQKFGDFIISKNPLKHLIKIKHLKWGEDFNILVHYYGKSSFTINIPNDWKTEGLSGNQNGIKDDDLCFRYPKTKCLSLKSTSKQVHEFGLNWKVNPNELIFEKWMSVQDDELRFKKLNFTQEQLQMASMFCLGDKGCAYDLISTGNKEFARNTLHDNVAYAHKNITYVGDDLVY